MHWFLWQWICWQTDARLLIQQTLALLFLSPCPIFVSLRSVLVSTTSSGRLGNVPLCSPANWHWICSPLVYWEGLVHHLHAKLYRVRRLYPKHSYILYCVYIKTYLFQHNEIIRHINGHLPHTSFCVGTHSVCQTWYDEPGPRSHEQCDYHSDGSRPLYYSEVGANRPKSIRVHARVTAAESARKKMKHRSFQCPHQWSSMEGPENWRHNTLLVYQFAR